MNSWLHKELPFNNCMAKFGSLPGPGIYTHGESVKEATWRQQGVIELDSQIQNEPSCKKAKYEENE